MRNAVISDNKLLRQGLQALRRRLPSDWSADLVAKSETSAGDACFRVVAPNGKVGRLAVEVKKRLEPRGVVEMVVRSAARSGKQPRLLIAPYLSPAVRERLREASFGFLDLTGNARIELREPGLFIEGKGLDRDPNRAARPSRSLRGAKAGRIVRLLVDSKEPPGVRQIAERIDVDAGYVSRVLALLDREALIERQGRGRITTVDWPGLLRRWAAEAPIESRGEQRLYLEPRGIPALRSRLTTFDLRYAVTGTLAAMRLVPVAPPRLAFVYVEDLERSASQLELRSADSGANVLLIEPVDAATFAGRTRGDGITFAAVSQVAADLLTSPGRGPQEAEELIDWMTRNEDAWRG